MGDRAKTDVIQSKKYYVTFWGKLPFTHSRRPGGSPFPEGKFHLTYNVSWTRYLRPLTWWFLRGHFRGPWCMDSLDVNVLPLWWFQWMPRRANDGFFEDTGSGSTHFWGQM